MEWTTVVHGDIIAGHGDTAMGGNQAVAPQSSSGRALEVDSYISIPKRSLQLPFSTYLLSERPVDG